MLLTVFGLDPVDATAWGTIVLAAVGAVSIITNVALGIAAFRSASASKRAISLQETEIEIIKRELAISESQIKAAQDASRPRLKVLVTNADPSIVSGTLMHFHGNEPAIDVEIWLRTMSLAGAAWGLFVNRYSVVVPGGTTQFRALAASAADKDLVPMKEMLDAKMGKGQALVAIVWKRLDGSADQAGPELQELPRREPPGIAG
jgi:hypothetical protein